MKAHLPDCPARNGADPDPTTEFRVNMTEGRDSWQAPHFLAVCCSAEGERLTRDARMWSNGKPRRWVERRIVEPWRPTTAAPVSGVAARAKGAGDE